MTYSKQHTDLQEDPESTFCPPIKVSLKGEETHSWSRKLPSIIIHYVYVEVVMHYSDCESSSWVRLSVGTEGCVFRSNSVTQNIEVKMDMF